MLKKYRMVLDANRNSDISIHVEVFYKGQRVENQIEHAVFDFMLLKEIPDNELITDGLAAGIVTPIYDEDTGEMYE